MRERLKYCEVKKVPEFKRLLVEYYEGADISIIGAFLKDKCWKKF